MAEIINIKNEAGEVQYPVTKPECVIDESGKNVLQLIRENGSSSSYDDTEIKRQLTELSQEKEDKTNKVTSLTEESTDVQYPSAKAVYALSERISENEILIEDLQNTKIDKEADDYYPKMAVGLADNLAGVDVVDSEVNFRRSGGGAISDGVARIEAIKGNSVVWNQRFAPRDYTINGITTTYQDGKYHSVGQLTSTFFNVNLFDANELNHKYLFIAAGFSSSFSGKFGLLNRNAQATITNGFAYVLHDNTTPTLNRYIGFTLLTEGDEIDETYTLVQYDLTQMFGAGNEPTTIEEFYSRIPMGVDLNAYNEGEVIHMDVQSIESQGVNAWDEEWEIGNISGSNGGNTASDTLLRSKNYIPIIPSIKYYSTIHFGKGVIFYDDKKEFITRRYNLTSIPQNARYMRFVAPADYGTTYKNDICINIYDASINGKYFPYIKRVEDLSIIRKYFPNGMKSAGSAHDEIRYNKEINRWEAVKRIGEVDLGTLNWIASISAEGRYGVFPFNQAKAASAPTTPLYVGKSILTTDDKTAFIVANGVNSQFFINDKSFTDAASFKAAMQGVIAYYELAEPIVTELDAEDQFKDLDYQVWNCGTEKAIAEGKSAPLAADITYGFNAIGKIKELESLVAALRAKVGI